MLAVLLPSLDDGNLSVRAMSLKHIEEIVAQSGTFNILEIVPEAQAATIGYYIDGQEPVAGWKTTLGETATPAARIRDANALFQRLDDNGILSGTTSTPLRYTYVEGSELACSAAPDAGNHHLNRDDDAPGRRQLSRVLRLFAVVRRRVCAEYPVF